MIVLNKPGMGKNIGVSRMRFRTSNPVQHWQRVFCQANFHLHTRTNEAFFFES